MAKLVNARARDPTINGMGRCSLPSFLYIKIIKSVQKKKTSIISSSNVLGIAALHSMWNTAVQLQISLLMHLLQRGIHFGFRHNLMLPKLASSVANLLPQLPNMSFICFSFVIEWGCNVGSHVCHTPTLTLSSCSYTLGVNSHS